MTHPRTGAPARDDWLSTAAAEDRTIVGMRAPRAGSVVLLAVLSAASCTEDDTFSLRFPRSALRQVVREVRVFIFAPEADGPPTCARLDPRGAPFGDAESRTGLTARHQLTAPLDDEVGKLPDVAAGRYTLVVEAWSPPCIDIATDVSNTTFCRRTDTGPSTVLRGYACQPLSVSGDDKLDLTIDMRPLAELGTEFQLPESRDLDNPVNRYDEASPQPVVEGVPARVPYRVQLVDELGDDLNGVSVHWAVEGDRGTLVGPATVETADDPVLMGQGIAQATLQANQGAAATDDGFVVVSAYAPGFENAPFRFYAKAVPSVRTALRQVSLPRALVDLEAVEPEVSPVLYEDLNADGRPDVATVTGVDTHRLVVLFDRGDGQFIARVSEAQPGMARGLTAARTGDGPPTLIVSAARRRSRVRADTPDGPAWIVESPTFELWDAFQQISEDPVTPGSPRVLSSFNGTPIDKVAISIEAGDIDADGYDELIASRCSYFIRGDGADDSFTACYGPSVIARGDSELVVLSAVADSSGAVIDYEERAVIPYVGIEGGYRKARFADINRDGSLDIIANNAVQVVGRCGARNQPSTGFGFAVDGGTFIIDTGFSQNFDLAAGRFNDDALLDVVSTGALRLNSADSGFAVILGGNCTLPERLPAVVSGPRTNAHMLVIAAAELNGDAWDDVLLLHRAERQLQLFFGAGTDQLAEGPVIDLPTGLTAEFDIVTGPERRVAIPLRRENAVLFVEIEPDR